MSEDKNTIEYLKLIIQQKEIIINHKNEKIKHLENIINKNKC